MNRRPRCYAAPPLTQRGTYDHSSPKLGEVPLGGGVCQFSILNSQFNHRRPRCYAAPPLTQRGTCTGPPHKKDGATRERLPHQKK